MKLSDFNFCLHYHIKDVVSLSSLKKNFKSQYYLFKWQTLWFNLYINRILEQSNGKDEQKTRPVKKKKYNCLIVCFLSEAGIFLLLFLFLNILWPIIQDVWWLPSSKSTWKVPTVEGCDRRMSWAFIWKSGLFMADCAKNTIILP